MDCKDAEKYIPVYLNENPEDGNTKEFLDHIETCSDCREELTIQFLIATGLQRLEDGSAFDLTGELRERITDSRRRIRLHRKLTVAAIGLQMVVVLEIAAIIGIYVMNL